MTKIAFEFNSYSQSTGGYDPDDSWSRDSTSTSWTAPNVCRILNDEKPRGYIGYEIDEVPDTVKRGDTIYMVWVQWSSGDSFGHDDGAHHEVIGFYQTAELAEQARKAIDDDSQTGYSFEDGGNRVRVPLFDGSDTREQYTGSWKGYFESLDHVDVQPMIVS